MKVQDWRTLLKGSFAYETASFACSPCDADRARKMFHAALNAGVTIDEIVVEAKQYLASQGCCENFITDQIKLIRGFRHNPRKKLKSKRAWLITWEGTDIDSKVAAILNYRRSPEAVSVFVEQLYIASKYSNAEKLVYAKSLKNNPYRPEYDTINGIRWGGRLTCGHNPFLDARIVVNLAIIEDESGEERLVWEELERPYINH